MQRSDFAYDLPQELIAQEPLAERSASRLLVVNRASGNYADRRFSELPELLNERDLLVVNDTRVLKARLLGRKATGGRTEVLIDRLLEDRRALAFVRASKSPQRGSRILFGDEVSCRVLGRQDDLFELEFDSAIDPLLDRLGQVPLPPYIDRVPTGEDEARYQTVFAARPGAVAAPTAALHFDAALCERLVEAGIETAKVTLHVGAGTFAPLRSEDLQKNRLHKERLEVGADVCAAVAACRQRGGRVVAVGTTTVRALETAADASGVLVPFAGETDLFIRPGFEFKVADGLITNFHLPESSLLMLVSAFSQRERVLAAYAHAVERRYRFFSYGDAMLLL